MMERAVERVRMLEPWSRLGLFSDESDESSRLVAVWSATPRRVARGPRPRGRWTCSWLRRLGPLRRAGAGGLEVAGTRRGPRRGKDIHEDPIVWPASREAKALIRFDEAPSPGGPKDREGSGSSGVRGRPSTGCFAGTARPRDAFRGHDQEMTKVVTTGEHETWEESCRGQRRRSF